MSKRTKIRATIHATIHATKTASTNTVAPRNPFANLAIMRKGGVHQKSKSAVRAANRRETNKLSRDWSPSLLLSAIHLFLTPGQAERKNLNY